MPFSASWLAIALRGGTQGFLKVMSDKGAHAAFASRLLLLFVVAELTGFLSSCGWALWAAVAWVLWLPGLVWRRVRVFWGAPPGVIAMAEGWIALTVTRPLLLSSCTMHLPSIALRALCDAAALAASGRVRHSALSTVVRGVDRAVAFFQKLGRGSLVRAPVPVRAVCRGVGYTLCYIPALLAVTWYSVVVWGIYRWAGRPWWRLQRAALWYVTAPPRWLWRVGLAHAWRAVWGVVWGSVRGVYSLVVGAFWAVVGGFGKPMPVPHHVKKAFEAPPEAAQAPSPPAPARRTSKRRYRRVAPPAGACGAGTDWVHGWHYLAQQLYLVGVGVIPWCALQPMTPSGSLPGSSATTLGGQKAAFSGHVGAAPPFQPPHAAPPPAAAADTAASSEAATAQLTASWTSYAPGVLAEVLAAGLQATAAVLLLSVFVLPVVLIVGGWHRKRGRASLRNAALAAVHAGAAAAGRAARTAGRFLLDVMLWPWYVMHLACLFVWDTLNRPWRALQKQLHAMRSAASSATKKQQAQQQQQLNQQGSRAVERSNSRRGVQHQPPAQSPSPQQPGAQQPAAVQDQMPPSENAVRKKQKHKRATTPVPLQAQPGKQPQGQVAARTADKTPSQFPEARLPTAAAHSASTAHAASSSAAAAPLGTPAAVLRQRTPSPQPPSDIKQQQSRRPRTPDVQPPSVQQQQHAQNNRLHGGATRDLPRSAGAAATSANPSSAASGPSTSISLAPAAEAAIRTVAGAVTPGGVIGVSPAGGVTGGSPAGGFNGVGVPTSSHDFISSGLPWVAEALSRRMGSSMGGSSGGLPNPVVPLPSWEVPATSPAAGTRSAPTQPAAAAAAAPAAARSSRVFQAGTAAHAGNNKRQQRHESLAAGARPAPHAAAGAAAGSAGAAGTGKRKQECVVCGKERARILFQHSPVAPHFACEECSVNFSVGELGLGGVDDSTLCVGGPVQGIL